MGLLRTEASSAYVRSTRAELNDEARWARSSPTHKTQGPTAEQNPRRGRTRGRPRARPPAGCWPRAAGPPPAFAGDLVVRGPQGGNGELSAAARWLRWQAAQAERSPVARPAGTGRFFYFSHARFLVGISQKRAVARPSPAFVFSPIDLGPY